MKMRRSRNVHAFVVAIADDKRHCLELDMMSLRKKLYWEMALDVEQIGISHIYRI